MFFGALNQCAAGFTGIWRPWVELLAERFQKPALMMPLAADLDRLTPRQLRILRLIGEGKNGNEVAEALGVSPRTIEYHRAGIRRALGIATEWGLVRYAIVAGLASREPDQAVAATPGQPLDA